jgi:hypothetical protein
VKGVTDGMNIDARLKALMPPPVRPQVALADRRAWKVLEGQLRVAFPGDYRALVSAYGYGCVDAFLWLPDPFSQGWLEFVMRRLAALYELRAVHHGAAVPYALYPERGGLFPWAFTDNGDTLYWMSERSRVVVGEGRGPEWDEYSGSPSTYLSDLIERKISSTVFPPDFPGPPPVRFTRKQRRRRS